MVTTAILCALLFTWSRLVVRIVAYGSQDEANSPCVVLNERKRTAQCVIVSHFLLHVQIRFVLLLSRQGKVRLSKWYTTCTQKERAKVIFKGDPPGDVLLGSFSFPSST